MILIGDIYKSFQLGNVVVPVLAGISLEITEGQFVAITGPSGSGKSTSMNIIGLLDSYNSGSYRLFGHEVGDLSDEDATAIRNRKIGFVFQFFNLIPRFSAIRNVELPMVYAGIPAPVRQVRARVALQVVGLGNRMNHTSVQLSGGQQQRVAIARAIVTNPDIIIADEPTGALDSNTSNEIMSIFQQLNASGKTVIVVTHDIEVTAYAKRVIYLRDGVIQRDNHSVPRD